MTKLTAGWAVIVGCVLIAVPAMAQDSGDSGNVPVNASEAIPIGPFIFSPAVELTWEFRDNIFFAPPEYEVEDYIYLARARLMFELPVYDSYVRFSYTPQYREYKDYPFDQNWSHFVDAQGAFEFASGWKVDTSYRFITANLETREVDPGGEYMWGERQFDKHYLDINADYWLSATDGISLQGNLSDLSFDQPPGTEYAFYDYSTWNGGIGWLHQINPTAILDVAYKRSEFNSDDPAGYRDSESDEITIGLHGQVTPVLSSELRAGWRETTYGAGFAGDDYSSFVVSGGLGYELSESSNLRLDLVRSNYPSRNGGNAYYTATGGSLIYSLQLHRLTAQARLRLQNNTYGVPVTVTGPDGVVTTQKRKDDIFTVGLGASVRLTDIISLRGSYLYEDRDAIWPFYYETNIFVLGLVVGY